MREVKVGRLVFTYGVGLFGNPKNRPDGISIPGFKVCVGRVIMVDEDTGNVHVCVKSSGESSWVRKRSEVFLTKEEAKKYVSGRCAASVDWIKRAFSPDVQPMKWR